MHGLPARATRPLGAALLGATLLAACGPGESFPPPDGGLADAGTPAPRASLSVSPFTELLLASGLSFDDGTRTAADLASLQALFVAHGATEVYARIGTRREKAVTAVTDSTLPLGLDRARVAHALGLPFNPELGLFRTYGDLSCQTPPDLSEWGISLPGEWATLDVDTMATALRAYTAAVAEELLATGVRIEVWDLGNEVDFGTAGVAPQPLPGACDSDEGAGGWYRAPDGVDPAIGAESVASLLQMPVADRIAWLRAHVWPHEARLLAAAAAGVRDAAPGARIATHISTSLDPAFAVAFYQAMRDGGFAVDVAGFSFYPTASADPPDRVAALRATLAAVRDALGVPVFLAEVGYPSRPLDGSSYFSTWNAANPGYPLTPAGQHDLLRDLASWCAAGELSGLRPWGPELWVSDWEPMGLFAPGPGLTAKARPALDAIQEGLGR